MKEGREQNFDDIEFEDSVDESGEEDLRAKLTKLKEKLKQCEAERGEYLEGWQRARADLINERKENDKRRDITADIVRTAFIEELLPALDQFDMACANRELWEKVDKNWREGIEHIHSNLLGVLSRYGVDSFDPLGEPFNAEEHESLGSVPSGDAYKENTVAEVLQKGYRKNGVVIRPAKVKVAQSES